MLARKLAATFVEDISRTTDSASREQPDGFSFERHARELGIEAPLRDVSYVTQEFAWQWELARAFGVGMPCVRLGEGKQVEIVPLSLPFDWPFPRPAMTVRSLRRFFSFPPDSLYEAYREFLRSQTKTEEITVESAEAVLKNIQNGLGNFIAYRIGGYRAWLNWMLGGDQERREKGGKSGGGQSGSGRSGHGNNLPPPPSSSPGGGVGVEFRCNTTGLTIEFSHAYFVHFLNFGAPSSPVKNTLLGGRYVFQGKGPMNPSGTRRSQIFVIPPDYISITTFF